MATTQNAKTDVLDTMPVEDQTRAKAARTKVNAERSKIRKSTSNLGQISMSIGAPIPQGIERIKFETDLSKDGLKFEFTDVATLKARLMEDWTPLNVTKKDGTPGTLGLAKIAKEVLGESHGNVSRWVKSYCFRILFGQESPSVEYTTTIMQKIGWGRETEKTPKDGEFYLKQARKAVASAQLSMSKLGGFDATYQNRAKPCLDGLDGMIRAYAKLHAEWVTETTDKELADAEEASV